MVCLLIKFYWSLSSDLTVINVIWNQINSELYAHILTVHATTMQIVLKKLLYRKKPELKYFIISKFLNNDCHKSMCCISNESLDIENILNIRVKLFSMLNYVFNQKSNVLYSIWEALLEGMKINNLQNSRRNWLLSSHLSVIN